MCRQTKPPRRQARLKEKGHHTFIDKVSVRLVASEDKYWATLANFGDKYVHIPDRFLRDDAYSRLLQGGIWAQLDLEILLRRLGNRQEKPVSHSRAQANSACRV